MHIFKIRLWDLEEPNNFKEWEREGFEGTKAFVKRLIDEYKGFGKKLVIFNEFCSIENPLVECVLALEGIKFNKTCSYLKIDS